MISDAVKIIYRAALDNRFSITKVEEISPNVYEVKIFDGTRYLSGCNIRNHLYGVYLDDMLYFTVRLEPKDDANIY